eukprot:CAMPEP_0116849000 /NCGR_PEP_ID=MMETSP0418-20121206/15327_1 /TAXON_ID=1158023 /ORGANISM="Astrosyne radiata, Strain 13vi08-1A" /LENGTH=51 /DNA_ID=CAMNT_0004480669 /DNA_START=445 /DNA_END=600 /DNA_ORIENTATION=-
MNMAMEKPPALLMRLLGGANGVKRHMENMVILKTLQNFRDDVAKRLLATAR